MDEVRVVICGEVYWLWRAIDQYGEELEILHSGGATLRPRRDFPENLRYGFVPRVLVN